ncbi:Cysteine desulfurase [Saliniradius amylolyticus]|uniref:Cysteine desulfurase IscS n=1 Tax=Saliniradius amylolyticus TaxID=2183582 RepID=A0A2S2E664_9ALTE|nr:IscS subfamily cysteine desulfurase [Saliniradius amylolyticus]AWL12730.1 Cysteine desulfurase [Saliniradius amylolyticus]
MKTPIYLDYASTTPVDPAVAKKMAQCLTLEGSFANPASRSHRYGWQAEELVDIGRNQVAELVNADPREIVFTSGATESNNLAIKGAIEANHGKHIVTVVTEHKAVLDPCEVLESRGVDVTYLTPEQDGLIQPEQIRQALREDTALVSVMQVNNEIGVIQDIAAIGQICREAGVLLHVDAAQSAGKLPIDLQQLDVDLMSFSAHKNYGPKGIGALYVRRSPDVRIEAQIHGGGHERKMRSGTLPTHQIVGMGEAFARSQQTMEEERQRIARLRDKLWEGIQDLPGVQVNGSMSQRVAGNLNVSFAGVDGEALIMSLRDIAVSTGSACTSASVEPSYVLKAIGVSDELAYSSIRFSVGRFTTDDDIDHAISHIRQTVKQVRQMNELW